MKQITVIVQEDGQEPVVYEFGTGWEVQVNSNVIAHDWKEEGALRSHFSPVAQTIVVYAHKLAENWNQPPVKLSVGHDRKASQESDRPPQV